MNSATQNLPANMVTTIKAEIELCKTMAATAFAILDRAVVTTKWRDLCDALATLGLSVAHFEVA